MPSHATLAQQAAPGEILAPWRDHAELVPFGVGKNDVALLGTLPDITVPSAEAQCRRHRVLLVGEGGAGQVQVQEIRSLSR